MTESQENATTAALRELDIPVTTRVIVDELSPDSPAKGKLRPGDVVLEVDGKPAMGGARLRDLITAHEPGEDGAHHRAAQREARRDDGHHECRGRRSRDRRRSSRSDDADYPFTVEISLATSAARVPG